MIFKENWGLQKKRKDIIINPDLKIELNSFVKEDILRKNDPRTLFSKHPGVFTDFMNEFK